MNKQAQIKVDQSTIADNFVADYIQEARLDAVYKQFEWLEFVCPRETVSLLDKVKRFDYIDLSKLGVNVYEKNHNNNIPYTVVESKDIWLVDNTGKLICKVGSHAVYYSKYIFFGEVLEDTEYTQESVREVLEKKPRPLTATYIVVRYNKRLTVYKPNTTGQTLCEYHDKIMNLAKAKAEKEAIEEITSD